MYDLIKARKEIKVMKNKLGTLGFQQSPIARTPGLEVKIKRSSSNMPSPNNGQASRPKKKSQVEGIVSGWVDAFGCKGKRNMA